MKNYDLIVVGGGPAGLAAALAAYENGVKKILILERDKELGGILNQCIHNGFGLHYFKEELTGPEYAQKFIDMLSQTEIEVKLDTMVLEISPEKEIHAVNKKDGYLILKAKAVILTMGCRERTRGAISIPGDRPAGVFTAGTAQRYINMEGYMVGKRVLILGSGDIGLIMARRLTLEGAKVLACVELMPYSNGLNRNIAQCLNDYQIPLYLSHTITEIKGKNRVEKVIVSEVDEHRKPIPGTEIEFDCDTVLLSVGLIPENELSKEAGIQLDPHTNGPIVYENMETSIAGIFAAGNVVHVHDLVDFVTEESQRAGKFAAQFIHGIHTENSEELIVKPGNLVGYTVPQHIRKTNVEEKVDIFFRVRQPAKSASIVITDETQAILLELKREHMAPGEMEHLVINKQILEKSKTFLTVSVRLPECQKGM